MNNQTKGVVEWVKEIQSNENFAKKFKGMGNVSDILKVARENGYNITAKELEALDLNSIAGGGIFVNVNLRDVGIVGVAVGRNSTVIMDPTIEQND